MTDAVPAVALHELVRTVAGKLGDSVEFEATGGSSTTLIDTLNVPYSNVSLNKMQLLITSGAYAGQARVIVNTEHDEAKVTFQPPLDGAIVAGVSAFAVNRQGGGASLLEYKRHVNGAIRDSYPVARTAVVSSPLTIDVASPTLTVPTTMNEVYGVEWRDDDGVTWRPLSLAGGRGADGWYFNQPEGVLTLDPEMADYYHGQTVRLRGEGRYPELVNWTDTTTLNPQWICSRAAYTLALNTLNRDIHGDRARLVLQFQNDSQQEMALIRTRREPWSVAVRQD